MSYKVIIAEKPSVAGSIAKIVGATTPHREKANGYLEGNGYRVTWAFGHLVGLDRPEDMGFPGETLPIFPEKWKTHIIQSGKGDSDAVVKKQMKTIDGLFKGASEIIVATDAGREGELIFRYIYEYLGCSTPFRRLWISSLTDEAIREGMRSLLEGHDMDALSEAAHARSEADYLVGFNASRALRLSSGYKGNLSLGRVQTPVLCMVTERYLQNKNFVPTPFWQISAAVHKDMTNFTVLSKRKYDRQEEAKADEAAVAESKQMRVVSVEKKRVNTKPPLLYDLTELQRQANSRHSLTADETLKIAQSLYEQKYISYPRTGSRYIPEDVYRTIPTLIEKVAAYGRFKENATALQGKKLCRRSVDDTKVTDHHALLPTTVIPSGLSGNDKIIYEMIAGRMLEAFGEDAIADRTSVELDCAGIRFTATGSVPVKAGWKAVFGADADEAEKKEKEDADEQPDSGRLPEMKENESLPAGDIKTLRKETKPLPIYTDASLLGDMQTCGKKIEDEELREAMKDVGLGTPATRAAIIETLLKRGYVSRQGKKLVPTELGTAIATTVKGRKIADVQTTGEWERELSRIEKGTIRKEAFDKAIHQYVLDIIEDLRKNCTSLQGLSTNNEPTRNCPCCGKPMKNLKFSISCDAEAGGCGFKIYRELAQKKLPQSAIDALAAGKETALIKGFKTKEGKSFDRKLTVNKDERKVTFVKTATTTGPTLQGLLCPCCGDTLVDDPWKLKSECGFILYKTQGGVALKEEQIRTLLSGGKVPIKGLTAKTGKKYNATFFINTDEKKIDRIFENNKKSATPV